MAALCLSFFAPICSARQLNNHCRCRINSPAFQFAKLSRASSNDSYGIKPIGRSKGIHPIYSQAYSTTTSLNQSTRESREPLKTLVENTLHIEEQIIKKSRFIGIATHCTSWDEAQTHLATVRAEHPKSRHVCFGFVSSSGEMGVGTERCSDDGEPTGTAGVPILGAIKGEELADVLCIVVRYFGGVKLGAGGLIRAYGSTARLVLRSAPTQTHIPKSTIRLSTRTANSGAVYAAAAKFGGVTSGECYNDRGELEVSITCDLEDENSLKEDIVDATRGGVLFVQ